MNGLAGTSRGVGRAVAPPQRLVERALDEFAQRLFRGAVGDLVALALGGDQPRLAEHLHVHADRGLGEPEEAGKFGDGGGRVIAGVNELGQDGEPRGVGEHLEASRGLLGPFAAAGELFADAGTDANDDEAGEGPVELAFATEPKGDQVEFAAFARRGNLRLEDVLVDERVARDETAEVLFVPKARLEFSDGGLGFAPALSLPVVLDHGPEPLEQGTVAGSRSGVVAEEVNPLVDKSPDVLRFAGQRRRLELFGERLDGALDRGAGIGSEEDAGAPCSDEELTPLAVRVTVWEIGQAVFGPKRRHLLDESAVGRIEFGDPGRYPAVGVHAVPAKEEEGEVELDDRGDGDVRPGGPLFGANFGRHCSLTIYLIQCGHSSRPESWQVVTRGKSECSISTDQVELPMAVLFARTEDSNRVPSAGEHHAVSGVQARHETTPIRTGRRAIPRADRRCISGSEGWPRAGTDRGGGNPMTWFNNLRLQFKLLAGFTLVLVLLAVVAVVGVLQLQKASDRTESMYSDNLLAGQNVIEANRFLISFARDFRGAVLATDPAQRNRLLDLARTELQRGGEYWAAYVAAASGTAAEEQLAKLEPLVKETTATRTAALDLAAKGDIEGGWKMETGHFDKVLEQNQLLQEAGEYQAAVASQARDSAADNAASSRTLLIALTVAATGIGFAFAFWLARSLSGAAGTVVRHLKSLQDEDLRHLQAAMTAMAAGDLTVTVKPAAARITRFNKDEVGQAAASVNAIIDTVGETVSEYNRSREALAGLIGNVQQNAGSILTASDQIRDASDQMAAATGQIATAINEVTRSAVSLSGLSQDSAREIERVASGSQQVAAGAATSADSAAQSRQEAVEMGERIQVVATASKEVAQAAEESRSAAQQGQQAVGQAVTSMESIAMAVQRASRTVDQLGEYGQQIGDIVKAIDEIAAQTNLLALNAAIEAARAGEQGRGFAVVAENVRSLAERSSESTKEIADLIAKVQQGTQEAVEAMAVGVRDVQEGQRITEEAGKALTSIIGTVELSATRMQEIARDVQGLASGAERIIASAEGIAELAKESAAGAGEMAAGTTRVTEAIIQVSATSEQTSASAEEVSASTEELSAQSEELAATANQMREMAEALQRASSRFKLA